MDKKTFINDVKCIIADELEMFNVNLYEHSIFEDVGIDSIALMSIIVSLEGLYNCEIEFNIELLKNRSQATLNDLYDAVQEALRRKK